MEPIKKKLNFEGSFVVDSRKRSGGLVIFWGGDVEVEVRNYTRFHITVQIYSYKEENLTVFDGVLWAPKFF